MRRVLIETYWNVKAFASVFVPSDVGVLIETYWNVKEDVQLFMKRLRKVLIETYWNVKIKNNKMIMWTVSCINRNILECKDA